MRKVVAHQAFSEILRRHVRVAAETKSNAVLIAWIIQRQGGAGEPEKCRAENGGRDRARTGDPLLAKQVLSQLSYTPTVIILSHYDGLRTPARTP
jgi:hypothetical protein